MQGNVAILGEVGEIEIRLSGDGGSDVARKVGLCLVERRLHC